MRIGANATLIHKFSLVRVLDIDMLRGHYNLLDATCRLDNLQAKNLNIILFHILRWKKQNIKKMVELW